MQRLYQRSIRDFFVKISVKIALILLICAVPIYGATLSGYVVDAKTGETVIGMNIIVEGTDNGSTTDSKGFFSLQRVEPGKVTLLFSHIGYQKKEMTITVTDKDQFLGNVSIEPRTIPGKAIEVSGRRGEIIAPETDISSFQVEPVVLKEVPQLNKDVFQLIKYSPSVTISDAISPLYYVRGGSSGENLVQLDGMTIYNPQHALSLQAIFNPYAIKNIEMLMGGFDAEYGGRNSSILNITTREGNHSEMHGEFRPSTSGVVGAIEFPVSHNSTAMLSGRVLSSLIDKILVGVPNVMADFNGTYQLETGRTKLRLSTFYARDYMNYSFARFSLYFDEPLLRDMDVGYLTNTSNLATGLQVRTLLTPNLVWESHLYYSGFSVDNKNYITFNIEDTTQNADLILNYRTHVKNSVSDWTLKSHLSAYTNLHQTIKLGFEGTFYRFYNRVGEYQSGSRGANLHPRLSAAFIEDQIKFGAFLAKIGLRTSAFTPEGIWRTEPRISSSLKLPWFTVKFAWGRYYQYITTLNSQDYELSQYLDYYYPLRNRTPMTSIHNILGFEGSLSKNLDYTATAYYKEMPRDYRFDYSNSAQSVYAYQAALEAGTGKAYGIEFMLRGSWNLLSGWIGYSLSRSTRRFPSIQNGASFLADGDQTHNLKAVMLYNLSRDITGSVTFQFTSGFPKTWETGFVDHYTYEPVTNSYGVYPLYLTPKKNNVRFPPRLVLDIGWKKKLRSGFGHQLAEYLGSHEAYFTMTVQNLLFLWRNPWMYFYIPDYGYYGYDFLPVPIVTVGYVIKF